MEKTIKHKGRAHRVFRIRAFGKDLEVIVSQGTYRSNGTLALQVLELTTENGQPVLEPFGMLTSNIEADLPLHQGSGEAFVKTWSENEGWALQIADAIGSYQEIDAVCRHVSLPLYSFDLTKIYAGEAREGNDDPKSE